jgi:hypothetical protein
MQVGGIRTKSALAIYAALLKDLCATFAPHEAPDTSPLRWVEFRSQRVHLS